MTDSRAQPTTRMKINGQISYGILLREAAQQLDMLVANATYVDPLSTRKGFPLSIPLRQLASIAERAEKKVSSYKHNEALVRSLGDGLGLQQEHEQFAVRLLTELAAGFAPIAPSPVPGVPAHAGGEEQ
jgi:hypothetical protein